MLDTILFDLDGTLLPLDLDHFIKIYFSEIGKAFADIIEPKQLVSHIWTATDEMVNNIEYRTNQEVFMEKFGQLIKDDLIIYQNRFNDFYDQGFLKTRESVLENQHITESVRLLKSKGFNLVIATNPLFPEKAIYHRIQWAGCNPSDFLYISSYERNHYCKPQVMYYREILDIINKEPSQCLMVGNDVQEDMIASTLGIQTYLITDYLIHRNSDLIISTYQGNYHDFLQFVKQLAPQNVR